MLETAPSFSIYSNKDNEIQLQNETQNVMLEQKDFSFSMGLIKEEEELNNEGSEKLAVEQVDPPNSPPMYLGLRDDFGEIMIDDISEEYCKELVDEYPNHPILLKKFAQLMQKKGDLEGAEDYYFLAAQADPGDGESLAQYAQLVWELHHDHGRALTYFDLAAQTEPNNSNVMAAYAKFLWETEDEEEDQSARPDSTQESNLQKSVQHLTDGIDADTDDIESYYKRMIDENPSEPIFLKKYAQFLYQSKEDLQGAEEYYSRAILAKPQDGEMLSQFATLLWELYHNQERTLSYLERAIEAAPQNSDVLAAYARILWTMEDE